MEIKQHCIATPHSNESENPQEKGETALTQMTAQHLGDAAKLLLCGQLRAVNTQSRKRSRVDHNSLSTLEGSEKKRQSPRLAEEGTMHIKKA